MEPLIGVILGSASDLDKVEPAFSVLKDFGVEYEVAVISAHRTPDLLAEYASGARQRGLRAIIAAAGLSAALPGALAAAVDLPVVGLPLDSGTLGGMDALLSVAQMPPGVPVATVGIDNAANAALFALRILGAFDPEIARKLASHRAALKQNALSKGQALRDRGLPQWRSQ